MIPTPLKKFIFGLIEATDENKVRWNEGAPGAYFCNNKNYKLYISYVSNIDTEQVYFSFIIDKSGKETRFFVESFEEDFNTMSNLYSSIGVNANEIADIADEFFST